MNLHQSLLFIKNTAFTLEQCLSTWVTSHPGVTYSKTSSDLAGVTQERSNSVCRYSSRIQCIYLLHWLFFPKSVQLLFVSSCGRIVGYSQMIGEGKRILSYVALFNTGIKTTYQAALHIHLSQVLHFRSM